MLTYVQFFPKLLGLSLMIKMFRPAPFFEIGEINKRQGRTRSQGEVLAGDGGTKAQRPKQLVPT
jgi:hypothetical protein